MLGRTNGVGEGVASATGEGAAVGAVDGAAGEHAATIDIDSRIVRAPRLDRWAIA
jgi:hypothetical protein